MAETRELPIEDDAPQPSVGRAVARNTLIVMAAFILSRVLGLGRDIIIAQVFGTSNELGLYNAAFRIPDTIFLLAIGGVVGSAFIPVFSALRQRGAVEASWRLTSTLINLSLVVIAAAGLLAAWLAPVLVANIIAPGFSPAEQAETVNLTRVMLLSPLFLGLGGWAQGILNAENRFALSAFAPIFYNIGIIVGALAFAPALGVYGLAWGVVVGSALHFLSQVPGLVAVGMRYRLRLNLGDEGVVQVMRLFGPRLIGQFAFQANFIIITALASSLGGDKVAAINYAYNLMMLPFGVFALSLSTVIFPTLTAQYARGDMPQMRATLWAGVRGLVFISAASAGGLFALREGIIRLLYEHGGKFTAQSTQLVAAALLWFSLGLVSYAVVEVLTRTFYAMQDTRTPVMIAVCTVLLNGLLATLLVGPLGHGGLALSLAVSTTGELALLGFFLHHRFGRESDEMAEERATLLSALRSVVAAGLMAALLIGLNALLDLQAGGTLAELLAVGGSVLVGGAAYLLFAHLLGSTELREVAARLRRGRG